MENVRACPQCGEVLPRGAHGNRVFCSDACKVESKRPGVRTCERPGCTGVVEGDGRSRFCRKACVRIADYTRTVGLPANRERERPCPWCGTPFTSLFGRLACSAECIKQDKVRRGLAAAAEKRLAKRIARGAGSCDTCGEALPEGHLDHQRYCGRACHWQAIYARNRAATADRLKVTRVCVRGFCERPFKPKRADQMYCTRQCKNRDVADRHVLRRRCAYPQVEVDRAAIYERDNWTCYLCGVACDRRRGKGGIAPTLDHVVPLSKDGDNTEDNVRTACWTCNSRKNNSSLEEYLAKVASGKYAKYVRPGGLIA